MKDTRVIGVPRNAENILYGRLEGKGTEDCRDGMYRSRQVSPRAGAGCTAPKTQHTKEIIPDQGEKYSGAWATETKCAVICRPLPEAGCTAPRVRDHMADDCQYKLAHWKGEWLWVPQAQRVETGCTVLSLRPLVR